MSWYLFRHVPEAGEPEWGGLPTVREVLAQVERNQAARDAAYDHTRRLHVSTCRKGRVCSGTFACPCQAEKHKREETYQLPPSRFILD